LKEKYFADACAEYVKRLSAFCKLNIIQLDETALEEEGRRIFAAVPPGYPLVALCVEGERTSSEGLAELLRSVEVSGKSGICFALGGSNGLADEVKRRADTRISMSDMTFPHHLARVMLLEQVYRGFTILRGGKYHK